MFSKIGERSSGWLPQTKSAKPVRGHQNCRRSIFIVDLVEADLKKAVAEIGTENNYCIADVSKAQRKIRVNTVHPSPVDNRMMRSLKDGFAEGRGADVKKTLEGTIPLGHYAEPVEIAQLVLFLASDDSQFITGTTQIIDGGLCVQ